MKLPLPLMIATLILGPAAFAQNTQPAQPPSAPPASTPPPATQMPSTQMPSTQQPNSTQPMPSETQPATAPSATETPQAEVDVAMQAPSEWPTFEKIDANADGYVNKTEAAENSQLLAMWADLDQDQNGSLSSGEYARGRNRNDTRDTNR